MIRTSSPAPGIQLITLDDPERMNALSAELVAELRAAIERAEADTTSKVLIITGAGRGFCAGAVLGDLDAMSQLPDHGSEQLRSIYEGFLAVLRSSLFTIAAVNGAAVGAGLNLALAADIRVAGPNASFDPRFLQIGLHPGGGHTRLLEHVVGTTAAAAMLLGGERVDAQRSVELGLSWTVSEDPVAEATRIALQAATTSSALLRRAKQSLRMTPWMETHETAVEYELEHQLWSIAHRPRRDS